MKVTVIGKNKYLWQRIRLCLDECEVIFTDSVSGVREGVVIFDLDTMEGEAPRGAVTVSRLSIAELTVPFSENALREAVFGRNEGRLRLIADTHSVVLDGELIKLTAVEFALLCALYEKGGAYASRKELIDTVWHGDAGEGVVNVYVHYLREKLESDGEKLIFSSRKEGYRLSDKVLEVKA